MTRLLIIGCGDIARRAIPALVRHYRVYAAVRSPVRNTELRTLGVTPILADLDQPRSLRRLGGVGDIVLHLAPPNEQGHRDQRTRALVAALTYAKILPRRLIYISTSGVYGNCKGALVAEESGMHPQTPRAKRRADAERVLCQFGRRHGVATSILRVPGIYAANRLPLDRLKRGDPLLRADEDVYTNHIHADDLAAIVIQAITRGRPGRAYNAVDDSMQKMGDYFDLVADACGLPRAPRVTRIEAERRLSPAMLSFMGESRRLTNRRMKRELGVKLRYPTVAEGLAAAR